MIVVAEQYAGPPGRAHGGYLAGLLVDHLGDATVTLLEPVPTGVPLVLERAPVRDRVYAEGELVATATHRVPPIIDVPPVPERTARAAEARFAGRHGHPFPSCFVCGTDPDRPLALDIAPGPVGGGLVACTWTPDRSLAAEDGLVPPALVRAALDCPGGWTLDPVAEPVVLSTFAARVGTVRAGECHVLVAAAERRRGRMAAVHISMYAPDGRQTGSARATWLAVDEGVRHR
ncbi:hypothetical protein [Micromonospora sp. CPCC 205561]|uniref:hypothetical protein n=1 Tax=Micromonospora sp. CPCC 205561 TaxID=3122407 RepID=UPI002FF1040E